MPDTLLKFIPALQNFIPQKENQDKAELYLNNIFRGTIIEFENAEEIEFVDQGQNFDSVSCNHCGKNIDLELWQTIMDTAYKNRFNDLTFDTTCCHQKANLNDLHYNWPAGFAKFIISISNPVNDIQDNEFIDLENILDIKLKKIWAHY